MEYFSIRKPDGSIVSCVKEIPVHPEGIVIAIHGFTSSKESTTYQRLLKRLPERGFGVICMDLPGHGTDESAKETLRISGALDSIEAVERYTLHEYPEYEVFYFASSFGAYLTGLYISTREHAGRKLFWRSAAVNMPELFHKENPTDEERKLLKEIETNGFSDLSMDSNRPVRVTKDLYNDFLRTDLFDIFDPDRFGKHQIAMAHGREDDVICPEAVERFVSRYPIPVTWFPGEGHSLSKGAYTPEQVINLAVSLYREDDCSDLR